MPPKKKVAKGYKLAEPLPEGIILVDLGKKTWRLGPAVGQGGFGAIYSAQEENSKSKVYPYVVKIEPHTNGPLFVEINFYIRHARSEFIEDFKKERGLKTFGMPVYHGSGSLEFKGEKYRFLVMDKFHTDLYTLFSNNNNVLPTDTVFKIGLQILDVLEFIHQREYVHADIKASNILLGSSKEKATEYKQIYLVDFGLATKYTTDKEFKPNPKKAHDGTIEFLSRDAHQGVQTRRGDLEILAYNLIQWLGCKLPWESNLSDPKVVQQKKEENMATVSKMIKASFGSKTAPKAIVDFLKYLNTLKFNSEPNYKKIRDIFLSGIKEAGGTLSKPLQFSNSKTPLKRNHTPRSNSKTANSEVSDDEQGTSHPKRKARAKNNSKSTKNDGDGNSSDSSKETPKAKSRGRTKKDIVVDSENNDGEMAIIDNSEETVKPKKRGRAKKDFVNDSENNDVETAILNNNEETAKPKKRARAKKDFVNGSENNLENNDAEMATLDNSDTEQNGLSNITRRRVKNNSASQAVYMKKTKSLQDLSNEAEFDGYTDAMKEIKLKKLKGDVPLKKGRSRVRNIKSKMDDLSTIKENSDVSDVEEEAPKRKQRRLSDIVSDNHSDNELNHEVKERRGLRRKISKSLDDLNKQCDFEGYTDAMKEIMLKKLKTGGKTKRAISTHKSQTSTTQSEDDMSGFTEEMKAIALKKKAKENTEVPVATTSKTSYKKGLVKKPKNLKKVPKTHGEVLGYSDDSMSD